MNNKRVKGLIQAKTLSLNLLLSTIKLSQMNDLLKSQMHHNQLNLISNIKDRCRNNKNRKKKIMIPAMKNKFSLIKSAKQV